MVFVVGVFEENARLFFRQFNAIGPLFCSFVQHHQLQLRTSKTYPKRQKLDQNKNIDVQNLENIGSPFWCFSLGFFRHYATFYEVFWIPPMGLPFVCFDICNTMDVKKISKGPPFYIFRHCDTVQKSHFNFFSEIFYYLARLPLYFFSYFATNWSFTKPKGSLLQL